MQAALPQLGQGTYEIIVETKNGTLKSQGLFNFVMICTPPDQVSLCLLIARLPNLCVSFT